MIFSNLRNCLSWLFRFPCSLRLKQKEKGPLAIEENVALSQEGQPLLAAPKEE